MNTVPANRAKAREGRRARLDARYALRRLSTLDRVRGCGHRRIDKSAPVPVVVNEGVAHLANVQACGSVWACPVCSAKINQHRAGEIAAAGERCLAEGGQVLFLTHTVPHDQGDDLVRLLATIAGVWKGMARHRGWKADRAEFGIVGFVRSLEITHGVNGWHPHLHIALFLDGPLTAAAIEDLRGRLHGRWAAAIERAGYRLPLDVAKDGKHVGTDLQVARSTVDLADYLTKGGDPTPSTFRLGLELTRHDLKASRRAGRTPWGILADFMRWGDLAELALWTEYETATKGHRSLTWSRGLKDRYAIEEVTDDEAANPVVGGETVYELAPPEFDAMRRQRHGQADVLDAAEAGPEHLGACVAGLLREHKFSASDPPRSHLAA